MFETKKASLFEVPAAKGTSNNGFVNTAMRKSNETRSTNGALKFKSTGNDFVDQFGKLGTYRQPRKYEEIARDTSLLFSQNKLMTVMFIFFLRMITRVTQLWEGFKSEEVQKGSGLRHEGIMRMIWLHLEAPNTFWKNIKLYIAISSWKDIFDMLRYDLEYNGWENRKLDWNKFSALILAGLENPNTSELVKKYMPQIQSRSNCTTLHSQANTLIGKWLNHEIFGDKLKNNYKQYRKLKSSGKAHIWQQQISKRLFDKLDFNTIHGRALLLLVSGKFIANNKLEARYQEWIESKPVAKFTGYVHELSAKITRNLKPYQKETLNKQFDGLVELGKKNLNGSSLIVVRDTSGSMGSSAAGTKITKYDVAKALALYFSGILKGAFNNHWIEFNNTAQMHQWKGNNFVDRWLNDTSSYVGSTNFMSTLKLFVLAKKNGTPEADFPSGILCISDGEFNPAQLGKANVDAYRSGLRLAGFTQEYCDNFKIILWNIPSSVVPVKFETYGNVPNVFYLSGYDGSILAFLTGSENKQEPNPTNAEELFKAAMNQKVLQMIEL